MTTQVARLKGMLADCDITPSSRVVPLRFKGLPGGHRGQLNGLASAHFFTTEAKFDKLWFAWHNRQDRQEEQECWAISWTNQRTGVTHKRGRIVL